MNDCEFIGNLTKDPVIRNTKTGKAVASFSIATNRDYVTPQGEKKQLTDYVNVVAWGELASAVSQYLQKGKRVLVQGRQSTRSYDDPQGQKRWVTEIIARIIALPLPTHAQNQQAQQGGQQWGWGNGQQNGYNQPPQNSYSQPPQGNNYGQPCQQGQLSQVSPYQTQGNGYPQQGAAPHGDSTDWWGQFGHAAPQGLGNGKDEDIPF